MGRYVLRRLLWAFGLLVFVAILVWVIFRVLPTGDPAVLRAGRQPTPQLIESIRESLGLSDPWYQQLGDYLVNVFTNFDFGQSYIGGRVSVREEILANLPATISLTAGAVLVWLVIGLSVGLISALRRRSIFDRVAMGTTLVMISAPVYWLGLVSLYLFAPDIGAFPLPFVEGAGSYVPLSEDPTQWFQSLILPWFVLSASFAAIYARLLRSNLLDVINEDYIRTARAKGLTERRVVLRHGVRSAITPIVTVLGLDIGILLGGAILTESVFNIPGVGGLAFNAIQDSDLPMIQGTVLFGAFFIIIANLIVDIVYAFLDPRVRYS